jgi:serine protease Do
MTARFLASALFLVVLADPASAQLSANKRILAPFQSVVAKANQSTVRVRCDDKDASLGTVVFEDGYILTKASELRNGIISVRFADGTEYEAEVVGRHRGTDLAMLRVDVKGLKPVKFADTSKARVGHWLAAAGPSSEPVAVGILSAGLRKIPTDDPFNEESIIVNHNRGYMGIRLDDFKDPTAKDGKSIGALVTEVTRNTPASKAGIKTKDVIVAVNNTKVVSRTSLQEALEYFRPGESVLVTIQRDGEEKQLKLTLGPAPVDPSEARSRIQNTMGGELSGRRSGFPAIIQTDMVIHPTDCGGPVVDLDGNVLGINIARAGRVETWILPGDHIRPLLEDLRSGKLAPAALSRSDK